MSHREHGVTLDVEARSVEELTAGGEGQALKAHRMVEDRPKRRGMTTRL